MKEIEMTKMVEEMDLRNLTPEVDMTDLVIATPDINRPALQLTGYYEHFANERVQIIGYVEFTYLQHLEESERVRAFEEFVSRKIPCVIFTTKMIPGPEILELCNRYQVPAFAVDKSTSVFMAEIIRWLNVQLAPMISIHGVLVDVFGEGVLIMGESGIGKSEAALELIKRGHRLVSDDVVEISCDPSVLSALRDGMTEKGYHVLSAEVEQIPATYTTLTDEDQIKKMNLLLEHLEENDDVQNVYHNWSMPEDIDE